MTAVREARPDERTAVATVLDGAALAVDHDALPDRIATGDVLVAHEGDRVLGALVLDRSGPAARTAAEPGTGPAAEPGTGPAAEPGTGPAAEPGTGPAAEPGTGPAGGPAAEAGPATRRIDALAVLRRRRDQGIGTALVAAAMDRCDRLVATFDGAERPFYERLGFAIKPVGDARYRGVWRAGDGRPP